MYPSPSQIPADRRRRIAESLNAGLADGLDLHGHLKVAHWNVKGPLFPVLHPLFERLAGELASQNDAVAERAVTLGAPALGTARHVATASRIPEYPEDATRDLEHVRLLAERFDAYLRGLREARGVAEQCGDADTVDLLTEAVSATEKNAWFLLATAGG